MLTGGEHRRGQGVRDDLQVSAPGVWHFETVSCRKFEPVLGLEDIEAAGGRHTSGAIVADRYL